MEFSQDNKMRFIHIPINRTKILTGSVGKDGALRRFVFGDVASQVGSEPATPIGATGMTKGRLEDWARLLSNHKSG